STYTFTAGDAGIHTFTNGATLKTVGTRSITATDAVNSLSGSQTGIIVNPAATSQLVVAFPSPVTAGVAQSFTVRASDPFGNTTPAYTGSLTLSGTDSQAVFVPTTYVYTGADAGIHTFSGTLKTAGTQSI